jgi:hypothetical protein
MNDDFYTISQYIDCKTNLLEKIGAIDSMIAAMELKILDATGSAEYDEYSMDDGQMKVRTKYRSVEDVLAGIKALEQLKQRYVNRHNGHTQVFRGGNIIC